jgi:hypothetical protein
MWRWRSSGSAPSSCVQPASERAADSVWSSRHCSRVKRVSAAAATSPACGCLHVMLLISACSLDAQTCSLGAHTCNCRGARQAVMTLILATPPTLVADQLALAQLQKLQARQLCNRGHCVIAELLATAASDDSTSPFKCKCRWNKQQGKQSRWVATGSCDIVWNLPCDGKRLQSRHLRDCSDASIRHAVHVADVERRQLWRHLG